MGAGDINWSDFIQALLRWAHIIAGIIWIGHLYFFNWVNGPFVATLDKETKQRVVPELMPRALFWFRWGAAWTWITGFFLLALVYYHPWREMMFEQGPNSGWSAGAGAMLALTFLSPIIYSPIASSGLAKNGTAMFFTGVVLTGALFYAFVHLGGFGYRAAVIHVGATYGTLMAFNVWFKIWPAQQKIIPAIKSGQAPDAALAGMAGLRSKHNTYMSIPLVWAMINQHTAASFTSIIYPGASLILSVAIGWWVCSLFYKKGAAVKGF
jgi:uncharacterized membrane protein